MNRKILASLAICLGCMVFINSCSFNKTETPAVITNNERNVYRDYSSDEAGAIVQAIKFLQSKGTFHGEISYFGHNEIIISINRSSNDTWFVFFGHRKVDLDNTQAVEVNDDGGCRMQFGMHLFTKFEYPE